jgi:hypothetical protein
MAVSTASARDWVSYVGQRATVIAEMSRAINLLTSPLNMLIGAEVR